MKRMKFFAPILPTCFESSRGSACNDGFEFARGGWVGRGMGGWQAVFEVWVDGGMGGFKEWVDRWVEGEGKGGV
jgi:hypothetical protein